MQYSKLELPAGEGQLIVLYVNEDASSSIDVGGLANAVAEDATTRRSSGWRLVSVASVGMRLSGSTNLLVKSGGQFVTQAALMAVYSEA